MRSQAKGSLALQKRGGKTLKFMEWRKKSTPEYITQHQAVQGQERSDGSPGMSSSSQWLRREQSTEENRGFSLQNNLLQIHATYLDFLDHPPHTCLGLGLKRTGPVRRACLISFGKSPGAPSDLADAELNPDLSSG